MNRRSFFRNAGIGAAAVIAAPGVLTSLVENPLPSKNVMGLASQLSDVALYPQAYSELIAKYGSGFNLLDVLCQNKS